MSVSPAPRVTPVGLPIFGRAGDGGGASRHFVHDPAACAVLAESLGLTAEDLEREIAERARFLEELAERGVCDAPAVARAVSAYPGLP